MSEHPSAPPADPSDLTRLAQSRACCRNITRRRAGNFYYGLMLMPAARRDAMYALYAWMRLADDLADEGDDLALKRRRLAHLGDVTARVLRGETPDQQDLALAEFNIWPAIGEAFRRHDLPWPVLRDMLEGQLLDQHQTRYPSFEALRDYCYKVAGTVGLACLAVWGFARDVGDAQRQRARDMAIDRGIGLQLTNILRDLVEDARRDRLYLPDDELARHGADPQRFLEQIRDGGVPDAFDAVMREQTARAASYYQRSAGLEDFIDPPCRATCWTMMRIYRRLLDRIAADPRRVLRQRVRLGTVAKISIGLRAVLVGPPRTPAAVAI